MNASFLGEELRRISVFIERLRQIQRLSARGRWYKKKPANRSLRVIVVGKTGFEPATPCTPYKCATGLRHFPNKKGGKSKLKYVFLKIETVLS